MLVLKLPFFRECLIFCCIGISFYWTWTREGWGAVVLLFFPANKAQTFSSEGFCLQENIQVEKKQKNKTLLLQCIHQFMGVSKTAPVFQIVKEQFSVYFGYALVNSRTGVLNKYLFFNRLISRIWALFSYWALLWNYLAYSVICNTQQRNNVCAAEQEEEDTGEAGKEDDES